MQKFLSSIFVCATLLHVSIIASEESFDAMRESEKKRILKEFKKLYKERKNIQYNLRQTLKHARSKNLHTKQLSFFQPKHPMELTNVYVSIDSKSEDESQSLPIEDISAIDTQENDFSSSIPDSITPENSLDDVGSVSNVKSGIRGTSASPWSRK